MNTILIASMLAFFTDPTGGPTCEEELLECQDDRDVAEDAIEALVYSIDQLTSDPTGGGGAQQCTTQICDIVAACRDERAPDLGKCVADACSNTNNCL